MPLIGFAGAPFTLLCYLVCGRPSKEFAAARAFLYAQSATAQRLLGRLADAMAEYLAAGAGQNYGTVPPPPKPAEPQTPPAPNAPPAQGATPQ